MMFYQVGSWKQINIITAFYFETQNNRLLLHLFSIKGEIKTLATLCNFSMTNDMLHELKQN